LAVLTAKAAKFFAFLARQPIRATAGISIGLFDPTMDRRGTRFKLAGKILNATPGQGQRY
jgi:hypothetical protein